MRMENKVFAIAFLVLSLVGYISGSLTCYASSSFRLPYYCDDDQYCCEYMKCCDYYYGVYTLWYFWLLLVFGIIIIISSCVGCCVRIQRRRLQQPYYTTISSSDAPNYGSVVVAPTTYTQYPAPVHTGQPAGYAYPPNAPQYQPPPPKYQ